MHVYLVGDPKRVVWSKRPGMLLVRKRRKHNVFDLIDKIFENLNSISNTFQEPHDFLIFTDSGLFLFLQEAFSRSLLEKNTGGYFPDQENIHTQNY